MLAFQVLAVVGVPSKMSACMEIDDVRLRPLPPRVLVCVCVLVLRSTAQQSDTCAPGSTNKRHLCSL